MARFSKDNQPQKRGRGQGWRQMIIKALEARGQTEQDFVDMMVKKAMEPDNPQAGRIMTEVLARLAPIPKATAPLVEFAFPQEGTMVEKIDAVIAATAQGELPADVAQMMVSIMKTRVDVLETEELAQRLERLERLIAERGA